jgi:membrane-bound metal-dependent hydrolase YbcI (DUF457 family)
MLPWGHAAVGYLCYTLWLRGRKRHPPASLAVLALAVGTQFPDLIDKPLAWTFGILPSGRSLGHSLVFVGVLAAGLWWFSRRAGREREAGAFLCGHISHIFADVAPAAVAGEWVVLRSLAWPFLPVYVYPGEMDRSIGDFLLTLDLASVPTSGLILLALVFVVWVVDGRPGLDVVLDRLPN